MRCTYQIAVVRSGPAHMSIADATVTVRRADFETPLVGNGSAGKNKDAIRTAMEDLWSRVGAITDPCSHQLAYTRLWPRLQKPLCVFEAPPPSWFREEQVLGVDFEGNPPALVQIACKQGVYIDRINAPAATTILADSSHTHCVFGDHEIELVANPVNLQRDGKQSLVELFSVTFCPQIRFIKDKTIHRRVNWSEDALSQEALEYAALDAEVTRRLGRRVA